MEGVWHQVPQNGSLLLCNGYVDKGILRNLVVNMVTRLGSCCFPQVYSVIKDSTEGNSGLQPVSPMVDGEALPTLSNSVNRKEVIGMADGMVDRSELATALHKGSEVDDDADDIDYKILRLRVLNIVLLQRWSAVDNSLATPLA